MSGTNPADSRPLSPHLGIWRYHATMFASITHRFTGIGLYFGTFLIAAWLIGLASGPETYDIIESVIASIPGQVILFAWTVAVLFHFATGIRFLLWDGPHIGFDPKTASAVSIFLYAFAVLGSVAIWAAVLWL
ncbi:MAG: succinate dehydrogenase, cytochrome b556 subunit [Alphaproteobacteria bacterium]|nr:succinate dehydrogenase, cytochrome b556 subunit [Alphaproteobacteria bacterium]MBU2084735.1 succinate dehydrogenase, cytochrome b556 subunit [Alphaproteobacteria bacterium]MBU2144193.1 succinate dehydrogenase, cytochrome b556 subunit [Alphaproteobacteria bacterium]MBU2198302.1 succinate dehydrogenase, cytochrome b556 subunit [Alphaproteobacteria bacterium]